MNAKTLEAVRRHGEALLAAFPNATEKDPVALCKKLRRIETSLAKPLVDYCNGDFQDDEEGTRLDAVCEKARNRAAALLGMSDGQQVATGIHVNRDPRGYALKLDDTWTREYNRKQYEAASKAAQTKPRRPSKFLAVCRPIYTDMGGYGIIAPDLTQD